MVYISLVRQTTQEEERRRERGVWWPCIHQVVLVECDNCKRRHGQPQNLHARSYARAASMALLSNKFKSWIFTRLHHPNVSCETSWTSHGQALPSLTTLSNASIMKMGTRRLLKGSMHMIHPCFHFNHEWAEKITPAKRVSEPNFDFCNFGQRVLIHFKVIKWC